MEHLVIAIHMLVSIGIIALVMLQQGKGAEMGASFGSGASQTLFGSVGSGNALSHATAILTAVFFVTSIGLAVLAKHHVGAAGDAGVPSAEVIQTHNEAAAQQAPAAPADVPAAPAGDAAPAPADVPPAPAAPAMEAAPAAPAPDVPPAPAQQ